ncbi:hypothetical protein MRY08_05475 [Clostridioides difficile]|nr:hypothetical protein [Clostridioides difficile]MCI4861582.1 hypothetical protein [Clostridioides difficile]MCM4124180.1 hypothetical protein [Clostridioides difficile]MDI2940652.1 hypothetical protein [Clostridioides difficile]MDM0270730.1 hypothetical protein [Clostridioides difficile]
MLNILWRSMKWRFKNPISFVVTILQPFLWLVLYSSIANQTMNNININNYTAFILPGIIVLVVFSSCSSGGIINFIMKNSGSFYRVLIAPISRYSIVLGQLLEAILVSFIEVTILCSKYILLSKDRIWHWWNPTYDSTDIYDSLLFIKSSLFYKFIIAK